MYSSRMQRRRVLLGTGTLLASTIAGCVTAPGADGSGSPTDAVEQYFEALADGDRTRANRFAHPEGDYYIDDDHPFLEAREITIENTETVDVETGVRHMFEDPESVSISELIEDEKAALEAHKSEYGFDGYAYVRHDAEAAGLSFNSIYVLFEDDRWLIWSVPTFHIG